MRFISVGGVREAGQGRLWAKGNRPGTGDSLGRLRDGRQVPEGQLLRPWQAERRGPVLFAEKS